MNQLIGGRAAMVRRGLVLAVSIIGCLTAPAAAFAGSTTIDTTGFFDGSMQTDVKVTTCNCGGYTNAGEIFTAPAGASTLDSFSVLVKRSAGYTLRGELYAFNTTLNTPTGQNLYQSPPFIAPSSASFSEQDFALPHVPVSAGQRYVFFVTAAVDGASTPGLDYLGEVPGSVYVAGFSGNQSDIGTGFTDSPFTGTFGGTTNLAFKATFTSTGNGGAGATHPTASTVICNYVVDASADVCTVTVTDAGAVQQRAPAGTVNFTSRTGGTFTATSCALTPLTTPPASASCSVIFVPRDFPQTFPQIIATYHGDQTHAPSSARTAQGGGQRPSDTTIGLSASDQIVISTDIQAAGGALAASVSDGALYGADQLPSGALAGGLGPAVNADIEQMIALVVQMNRAGNTSPAQEQQLTAEEAALLAAVVQGIEQSSLGTMSGGGLGSPPLQTLDWVIGHGTFPPPPPPAPNTEGLVAYSTGGQGIDTERVTVQPGGDVVITMPSAELFGGGEISLIGGVSAAIQDALRAGQHTLDAVQQEQMRSQLEALRAVNALYQSIRDTFKAEAGSLSPASDQAALASAKTKHTRRSVKLIATTVRRHLHAGRVTVVMHLNATRRARLLRHRSRAVLYVRVLQLVPSRLLGSYPVVTIKRVTLTRARRHR